MSDLPEELQFRDVRKQAPVIISKEGRQVLAQNGTRFQQSDSGTTQIVFRLPNEENSSTDLSTMWITADLSVSGLPAAANELFNLRCDWTDSLEMGPATAAATDYNLPVLVPCDSIESCIKSVHILVNGSELERHDYYNYVESMLNMHLNNSNFSNSVGAGCMMMNLSPYDRSRLLLGHGTAARTSSNVVQVSFPLRWCGIANLRSLCPLHLLGGGQSAVEIRIFLENASNFLFAGALECDVAAGQTFAPPGRVRRSTTPLTYTLDNVRLNYDIVQTTDSYNSSLRSYLSSNQLTLPIDTYYSTQFQLASNTGWQNFTISTQMSDISAVYIGFVRASEQFNYGFCSTDRFWKPPGLEEARLQINGKPIPNVNIRLSGRQTGTEAEAQHYLMKSLRQNCSLEVIGNSNANKVSVNHILYAPTSGTASTASDIIASGSGMNYGYTNVVPADYDVNNILQPRRATTVGSSANDAIINNLAHVFESPTNFILGFDVSKSNYANEFELSGLDLTKSSGLIQVNLRFNSNPDGYTAIVVVRHKRILDIGLDSSQVIY